MLDCVGGIVGGPFVSESEAGSGVRRLIVEEPSAARTLCPLIVVQGNRPVSAFYPPDRQLPLVVGVAQARGDVIVVRHPDGIMEVWGA